MNAISMESSRLIQKKRTSNFREDETKLLIQLWGSPQVQNKLYLTHRKAPVMRILAASMQQHGFYRTPDEIKTRIRNLKCLYHRIKRSMQSGAGLGTVDPDWPHFKAMDEILSKNGMRKENLYKDNIFEGPRCEDIKQEIEDIDINDDMESYTTNSLGGSDYEEDPPNLPPLTPAPKKESKKENVTQPKNVTVAKSSVQAQTPKQLPTLLPNLKIPIQNQQVSTSNGMASGRGPSIPVPLLILNGVQPQQIQQGFDRKNASNNSANIALNNVISGINKQASNDLSTLIRELVEIQKEKLTIEKQRLEVDRQKLELEKRRLDFEHMISPQILAFAPLFNELLNRSQSQSSPEPTGNESENPEVQSKGVKRQSTPEETRKDSKILRAFLQHGLKQHNEDDDHDDDDDELEFSENEDSGIHNDENSNSDHSK